MNLLQKVNIRGARADKPLPSIRWDTKNCILHDPVDYCHVYVSLGTIPYQDDGVDMLSRAIEELGARSGMIEFVSLPSPGYKKYLEQYKRPKDTLTKRSDYLLSAPFSELENDWEASGRNKTDIAATVLFSIDPPVNIDFWAEYTTQYRLTKQGCSAMTELLASSYDDGSQLFVSREVIHWGDFLQDSGRYFWDGITVLNGGPRAYMGADLEQRYGTPADARFIAPMLCLPVVLRRPLPRVMSKEQGRQFLENSIPLFASEQLAAIFELLHSSGIPATTVYNRMMPEALMIDELDKIFAAKGCKFSV